MSFSEALQVLATSREKDYTRLLSETISWKVLY